LIRHSANPYSSSLESLAHFSNGGRNFVFTSKLASGAVIAAFAGVAASADLETTGTDVMKKADKQSEKLTETKEKAKEKASEAITKKD
jgi:hypothetical protein